MSQKQRVSNGYVEVSVLATGATEEGLSDFLFSEGALGLVIEDSLEDTSGHLIRASFSKTSPIGPIVERLTAYQSDLVDLGLAGAEGRIEVREVPVEDWGRTWKEHFKPLTVGKRLIIAPSWDKGPFPMDRHPIRIDPAMSFGTGRHATTRMCLEVLEAFMDQWSERRGPMVLDVGTGTGILAIGAAALGAQQVVALDIDPEACEAAKKNLALNSSAGRNSAERVQVLQGCVESLGSDRQFDLILANLDANGLCDLFKAILGLIAPGGRATCSGILVEQEERVMAAARSSRLRADARRVEGEWLCLSLTAEGELQHR